MQNELLVISNLTWLDLFDDVIELGAQERQRKFFYSRYVRNGHAMYATVTTTDIAPTAGAEAGEVSNYTRKLGRAT
jgi:hypothetical protein